jgi:phospholipid-transporting ATPase
MISHLFTDKTGTLTRNEMRFVNLILDGVIYSVYDYNFNTTIYTNHGSSESEDDSNIGMLNHSNKLYDICLCIATCNTIIRGQDSKYHAESPDEIALILGIEQFNCFIENRGLNDCAINIFGNLEKFEILALNKFSSDRRCMSVLLKRQDRDIDHNQYVLMCKGADITILPLCKGNISNDKLDNLELSIAKLSKQGLRILCLAKRELNEVQAKNWLESFNSASISLTNRPESLTQVAAIIEKDMVLLGVTAIEDQLQDEVPAVITDIRKAGIVTWMLTGDKLETAINISYSCNLIENDTTKLFYLINSESKEIFQTELLRVHRDIIEGLITIKSSANRDDDDDDEKDNNNSNFHTLTFVIDGGSLKYYDESNDLQRRALLEIGRAVNSVIACRVTPVQKQQLVSLIKNDNILHPISLAIGDGANDVSMIREAHVGIGIYGKEGHQAANNADFAISQFKFLRRLLLIHGRFNYIRQSHVFLYSMHRNIVVALTLFWYK